MAGNHLRSDLSRSDPIRSTTPRIFRITQAHLFAGVQLSCKSWKGRDNPEKIQVECEEEQKSGNKGIGKGTPELRTSRRVRERRTDNSEESEGRATVIIASTPLPFFAIRSSQPALVIVLVIVSTSQSPVLSGRLICHLYR